MLAALFFLISTVFVWRSFYGMRITGASEALEKGSFQLAPSAEERR
jgi:hypothetical protein